MSRTMMAAVLAGVVLAAGISARAGVNTIGRQSQNEGMTAVPAPGKVTVDGDFAEWDWSGRICVFADYGRRTKYSVEAAAMWDEDCLYLAAKWKDPLPLNSTVDPTINPDEGWKADSWQMRIRTDHNLWITVWYYAPKPQSVMHFAHWKDERNDKLGLDAKLLVSQDGSADLGDGAQMAHKLDADGQGFAQEMRIPWKLLYREVPTIEAGLTLRLGCEFLWGDPTGRTWPIHRYADNMQPGKTSREFYWTAVNSWGDVRLSGHGKLTPREYAVDTEKVLGTIPVRVNIPQDASRFTLLIEDQQGHSVRTLAADCDPADYTVKGTETDGQRTVEVSWDCLTDFGKLVQPGTFQVRGLTHKGIAAEYEMCFYNPGTPPWQTKSGDGSWGADHSPPVGVAAAADWTFVTWEVPEGGCGVIGIDPTGRKRWGDRRGILKLAGDEQFIYAYVARPIAAGQVYLGWRLLKTDPTTVAFDVYRQTADESPVRLNSAPLQQTTDFVDAAAPRETACRYTVRPVVAGTEGAPCHHAEVTATAPPDPAIVFKLDPATTVQKVGVGDLDGDGRYDYVLKTPQDNIDPAGSYWKPSPDTYHLQAYSAGGQKLWDHDLGWAIERGIWYSPMIVFDLDGDGRAEVALKSGEGDPRGPEGRVETGPEFLSILDGTTGRELARDDWPSRKIPAEPYNYNLSSRNQICVAYLDGRTPCLIVNRGTYTTIRLVAYQFHQGRLEKLWAWDSREETGRGRYQAQGAHIMHAADVDGDGRDEIILGSAVVDDNGNGLWTTELGHPDFCFVGDIEPQRPGLEIFYGIEPPRPDAALCLVDAKTGQILWKLAEPTNHVGTDGMCADIDPRFPGSECYAADIGRERKFKKGWLFSAQGQLISDQRDGTMSLPVYWDADPQRELIRGRTITDYRGDSHPPRLEGHVVVIADVLGDWREEIFTSLPGELRIYTTSIPASDRHICLMQDPIYRIDVAVAFMGYYAAPMLSYDLATTTSSTWRRPPGTH